jgi:hypothetical protein
MRVTTPDLDVPVCPEMPWPLPIELHLFLPSPIGKSCKRNEYRHRDFEHFSAVQPVIVPTEDVVVGEHVVHVTDHPDGFDSTVEFVPATSRSGDRSDLQFARSCAEERGVNAICECKNAVEDMYQTRIAIVADCR